MARPLLRCALVLAALLVSALATAPTASAYVLGGTRWPGTTIRYHKSFPPSWDYALGRAVGSWNRSGANIRFVKVSRASQAQVRMFIAPNVPGSGDATLGYSTRSQLRIRGNPRRPAQFTRANSAGIAMLLAHELGHVLGLHHVRSRCSIMGEPIPTDSCGYDAGYALRCSLFSRDDQRGVIARYGRARVAPRVPPLCFHGPATPAPANVTVSGAGSSGATARVSWSRPPGTWVSLTLSLYPAGRCGSTAGADNLGTHSLPTGSTSWIDTRADIRPLGSVCMQLQAHGLYGRPATVVRRTITYTAWPVGAPNVGALTEWPTDRTDYSTQASFANADDSPLVRSAPGSSCAATPEEGTDVGAQLGADGTTLTLHGVPLGEQCLSFFATRGIGWSTPVTRLVNHVEYTGPVAE